jgi:DNA-binding response OmpR family regulator
MHTVPSDRILFGAFELNLSTGELRSIEAPDPGNPDLNNKVILREQVFQVLRMLLEREGEIVTREEIKKRLWASDTTVDFDRSINVTINDPSARLRGLRGQSSVHRDLGAAWLSIDAGHRIPGVAAGNRFGQRPRAA